MDWINNVLYIGELSHTGMSALGIMFANSLVKFTCSFAYAL